MSAELWSSFQKYFLKDEAIGFSIDVKKFSNCNDASKKT